MRLMKHLILMVLCMGAVQVSLAQTEEPKTSEEIKKEDYKKTHSLFEKSKKAWSLGIYGGYPFVSGDIPMDMGIGYGGYLRKALGYSFSLRLNSSGGYMSGMHYNRVDYPVLRNNSAMNGKNNPDVNYFDSAQDVFTNFRSDYISFSIEGVYNINNVNFMRANPRVSLYVLGGLGGLFYSTYTDQLDANGQMYDYSTITYPDGDAKSRKAELKSLRDGTYETKAEGFGKNEFLIGKDFSPLITAGLGADFKLSKRITVFGEGTYGFTGEDLLDGNRWYNSGVPSSEPDAMIFVKAGIGIKLGRPENADWFNNPLTLPYQTILDNKKKLQKVDQLEKQVADAMKKMDTLSMEVDELSTDTDNDGVSDKFDRELSTPPGSIVNGAGETILYKDPLGNLIYNDPTMQEKNEWGKSKFDYSDKGNKTTLLSSDGQGGLKSPGTYTSIGYLPAIFFESDDATVRQQYNPELFAIAMAIKQNPGVKVRVIGYADNRSSASYNQQLGMRRANEVVKALTTWFGVPADQLIAESKGEAEQLSNTGTMNAMAANRRVQFQVDGQKKE